MSVFTESTQLTGDFESFRNLCVWVGVRKLKFVVHFLDSGCPACITFYRCNRPPKGTDPEVCSLGSSQILL